VRTQNLTAAVLVAVAGALLAPACLQTSSTCEEELRCGVGGSAGTAGTAGTGNASGASSASGGGAGTGGNGGSVEAGASAVAGQSGGGASPCDGACPEATPVCNAATHSCVECLSTTDCTDAAKPACDPNTNSCVECVDRTSCAAPMPACDASKHTCVECTAKTDCTTTGKPLCDTTAEKCVACLQQSDCTSATASACTGGTCTACTKDADCSNIAGKGVCNAGTCVQCTGTKFAACGSSMGTPLVCDSLMHTCTADKQASAGLCQPCVSDAQCTPGKMCVQEQFGTPAQSVGYFCFWKKGDTADGAPATCLPGADPYAATLMNATSIDGTKSDICSLRSSTCVARNQFSSKDCKNVALPDDSLCGFAPTKDSKCAQADVGVFRCTLTCGSNDDCPSPFTCNTGATPAVCNLQ